MEDIKDIWKREHQKTKERIRKEKINKELHQRRLNVQKRDQISNEEVPEEEEVIKEAPVEAKWYMNLTKHSKRKKKRGKKCWWCKSPLHLKKHCPFLRCFYCGKKGHIKTTCFRMKIDFIFKWLMEMTRNQQEAYKRRNQTRINIINTMEKLRYKKDFQGNKKSYKVIYGNQEVGTYIGPKNPTPPQQLIRNLKNKTNNIRHLEVTIRKDTQLKKLQILKGYSNSCGCGESGIDAHAFKDHVINRHSGFVLANSTINRPPWMDWYFFFNDYIEEAFQTNSLPGNIT